MLDTETKKKIDSARDILVGKIPDPTAQVDQITTALIYKFMDDMDQESKSLGGTAKFFIGDFKKYSWPKIIDKRLSGQERLNLYMQAIEQLSRNEKLPSIFREIFKNASLPYRDAETLNLFLKEINGFTYDHSENLGNAFEYLLSILGSQGDAGQFRTPRHIIDFIVEVIDPKKEESILDPACGTSGFLISSYKHIIKHNSKNYKVEKDNYSFARNESSASTVQIQSNGKYKGENLKPKEKNRLEKNIVGYDISPKMVKLSLVNMYLHHFKKPEIYEYDSLTKEDRWDNDFDVILANPPFMSPKGGIRPHNKFSVKANRAEVLFVDYIAEHLTINGRAGIIVPEGIIFKADKAYKALRKRLVEDQFLWVVASLPAGIFKPYSGQKTNILFLDKKKAKNSNEILFVNIQNDGFDLGATRRKIDKNDLPQAFKILKSWGKGKKETTDIAHWVSKEKIIKSEDYNLTGNRYKEVKQTPTKWPMVELGKFAEVSSGNSAPQDKNFFIDGIYPFCRTSDVGKAHISSNFFTIKDHLNKKGIEGLKLFKKDTILFPKSGASTFLNHRVILGIDSYVSSHLATIFTDKSKILPKFLFNLLCSTDAKKLTNQQDYPSLRLSAIKQVKIPLPSLEVQKVIVDEIDSYQKIISSAKQIVETWKPTFKIDSSWPIVELEKVFKKVKYTNKIKKSSFLKVGKFPIIDQSENFIAGYWNKKTDVFKVKNPVIVFGDHTCCFKYIDFDFVLGADGIKVIQPNKQFLPKFLYYLLLNTKIENLGYSRHFKTLKIKKIPFPPLEIQKEIVEQIEKEKSHVESCKELIKINTEKTQQKINEVWEQK